MQSDAAKSTLTPEERLGRRMWRDPFLTDLDHAANANGVPVRVCTAIAMLCMERMCDRRLRATFIGKVWVSSVFIDTFGTSESYFESMTFGAYEEFASKHDTIEEALEWHERVVVHLREVRKHFKKYRRMKKWQKRLRQITKLRPLTKLYTKVDQLQWLLSRLETEFPLSSRFQLEARWAMENAKSAAGATNT